MSEGRKDDSGKLRYELYPPDALAAVVAVLSYGAAKYEPRNWERGMAWSRLRGALDRHMAAFDHGEDTDPETGLPHLAHAACCLTLLLSYQLRNAGEDDLPRNSQGSRDWQAAVTAALSKLPPKI